MTKLAVPFGRQVKREHPAPEFHIAEFDKHLATTAKKLSDALTYSPARRGGARPPNAA